MYEIISTIGMLIRNFLLPNPFEALTNEFYIYKDLLNLLAEGILYSFTYFVVGLFYKRKSFPALGSFLYLVFYCLHTWIIYIMAKFNFESDSNYFIITVYIIFLFVLLLIKYNIDSVKKFLIKLIIKVVYRMKKKQLIDPYEPCLCGSGEKYKFCCYKRESKEFYNPTQLWSDIQKNKRKIKFCLYKNCDCNGKIIKAHTIQNNKILSKIAYDNHVYTIRFNEKCFGGFDLGKCGKNDATVIYGFCNYHDTKIFKDIELKNYNFEPKQNLLYAYRAFSKHCFDILEKREEDIYLFKNYNKFRMDYNHIMKMRCRLLDIKENNEIKDVFNKAIISENYDVVETVTATLNYEISFATSYTYSPPYDFEGNLINDVWDIETPRRKVFINIFPENGKSHIIISWLKSDGMYFAEYKKQFEELKLNETLLINTLNNMVACQSENYVISPKLIEYWGEGTLNHFKSECSSFFRDTYSVENIGMKIEKNIVQYKCKFNLFEKDIN